MTWTPAGRRRPVLDGVDLTVEAGERVLLAGASGAGKSTLLRALAGVLESTNPGELRGEVRLDGRAVAERPGRAGLLVQDPADARVAEQAWRDVAFGCENAALARAEIERRSRSALEAIEFPYRPTHPTSALSGGEAQRLAVAGVVAPGPGLLLLDEPTSMLDTASAARVRDAVDGMRARTGATLVVVEHRLGPWIEHVDRLVVLGADGTVLVDGPVAEVLARSGVTLAEAGIWVPGRPDPDPIEVPAGLLAPRRPAEGRALRADGVGLRRRPRRTITRGSGPRAPTTVLDGVDAEVAAGRLLAVRGASGAGKSTLLTLLCGLEVPSNGAVIASAALAAGLDPRPHRWRSRELAARVGWVPQQARATVVGRSVEESLAATTRALGGGETPDRVTALAEILGLSRLWRRNPHTLSGGEQRRLAVASGLAHGPAVLALDEPTVGQDRHTWAAVVGLVRAAREAGTGVVLSTHDDTAAAHADDTLTLARRAAQVAS